MPSQAGSGIRGIPWSRCDRCGLDFSLDKLTMQRSLLLCQDCFDDPANLDRDQVIAEALESASEEAKDLVSEVRSSDVPNDTF